MKELDVFACAVTKLTAADTKTNLVVDVTVVQAAEVILANHATTEVSVVAMAVVMSAPLKAQVHRHLLHAVADGNSTTVAIASVAN
jgi:hypothetical protein